MRSVNAILWYASLGLLCTVRVSIEIGNVRLTGRVWVIVCDVEIGVGLSRTRGDDTLEGSDGGRWGGVKGWCWNVE